MAEFHLSIFLPEKVAFKGPVDEATLRTVSGESTILADHEEFVTVVRPGILHFVKGGVHTFYFVNGGTAHLSHKKDETHLSIAVNLLEEPSQIDAERAKRAFQRATERLQKKEDEEIDLNRATQALERASARLEAMTIKSSSH